MYDYIILGAGIVGLSTAMQLKKRFPDSSILVIEKEQRIAFHQTGHNSGVIHSGIYYQPESYKAKFCRQGEGELKKYCLENNISYKNTGKLIVASTKKEVHSLNNLYELSRTHGIAADLLDEEELKSKEEYIEGLAAVFVHSTGIVDYAEVSNSYAESFQKAGGEIECSSQIVDIKEAKDCIDLSSENKNYKTKYLVACCGLQSDRIASLMGVKTNYKIIPIRGEYYQLNNDKKDIISTPIYPVPDPKMPFLGIHLTPMMNGEITVGPNAVIGWDREHYHNHMSVNIRDSFDSLRYPGFWKMAWANKQYAFKEMLDSFSKKRYVKRVQQYCPSISESDLTAYPTGIRAQAITDRGELVSDFLFAKTPRSLHVCNAPSPAATSSLPIGRYLCDKIAGLSI